MACSNLEETVLLYSSGELSEKEEKSFEEHMSMCDECRKEFDSYRTEQERFFTYDVLGEVPSKDVDKEILRVCSDARKKVSGLGIMPVFLKKTIYSLTFFVVGFVVVGYFAMNTEQSKQSNLNVVLENELFDSTNNSQKKNDNTAIINDSDSLNDTNRFFSKNRGNLDQNGVIPVDLKNK